MNFLAKIYDSAWGVLITVTLIIFFTITVPVFTKTELPAFCFCGILTLFSIFILNKLKNINETQGQNFKYTLYFLGILISFFDFQKDLMVISLGIYTSILLLTYNPLRDIKATKKTIEDTTTSFVTYADTCPDDNEDYGPEGSVIWGPRTIEENIYINGKWYINENSEEWEENEE